MTEKSGDVSGLLPQLLNPIDEVEAHSIMYFSKYIMQEKHDGRRLMVRKAGDTIEGNNRKGLVVALPQEIASAMADMPNCVLDGELVGTTFHVFDCISLDGEDISRLGYVDRFTRMLTDCMFCNDSVQAVHTAYTSDEKQALWDELKAADKEGVVFKEANAPYSVGRPNKGGTQLKYKFYDTLSAVVCKVNAQRSVALGLFERMNQPTDAGKLVNVGNVTISPNFDVPQVGEIVEIRYLYAYKGGSLYQPTYLGKRDDLDATACTLAQVKYKSGTGDSDEDA
jgi:bifunctional non-homologous end joining protein LigD